MTRVHSHPSHHAHARRSRRAAKAAARAKHPAVARPKLPTRLVAKTVPDAGTGLDVRATTLVGSAAGYATLEDAKADLARITSGPKQSAAGVFELNGRYYGSTLETVQSQWPGGHQYTYDDVDLEGSIGKFVKGIEADDPSLKLVVDGAHTLTPSDKPDASL